MATRRKTNKKRKPTLTAKNADRHVLYQRSVQDPEFEVQFVSRVYKKLRGRPARSMREDFCGTAHLCAYWIKSHRDRSAVGIDFDRAVLRWGKQHNIDPLGERGRRIRLLQQDVRAPVRGPFDVAIGYNFSYWVFKTREDLRAYFSSVYRSLGKGGLLFLDSYGGFEAQDTMTEKRAIRGGFTYVWEQKKFNPIDHAVLNHIHFRFKDGSRMNKAFTYDWRYWTLPEVRELLAEAGFRRSTVYWEGAGADGEGDGIFRATKIAENETAWVAYVVAER